jgi:hypothetical protein
LLPLELTPAAAFATRSPEITVFLDHLITEFICCCIPVEFIGRINITNTFSLVKPFSFRKIELKEVSSERLSASICEPTRPAKFSTRS